MSDCGMQSNVHLHNAMLNMSTFAVVAGLSSHISVELRDVFGNMAVIGEASAFLLRCLICAVRVFAVRCLLLLKISSTTSAPSIRHAVIANAGELSVQASPEGGSSKASMRDMALMEDGSYRVNIENLEKAGTYTLEVAYNGVQIEVLPGGTFQVVSSTPNKSLDLNNCGVMQDQRHSRLIVLHRHLTCCSSQGQHFKPSCKANKAVCIEQIAMVHNPEVGAFRSMVTGYGSGTSTGELSGNVREPDCQFDEEDVCVSRH
eukprot:1161852-Pelagomonas_calceolata.AAC.2